MAGGVSFYFKNTNPNIKVAVKTLKFREEDKKKNQNSDLKGAGAQIPKEPKVQEEINVNDKFADLKEVGTLISKYIVSIFSANLLDYDKTNKPSFVLIMEYCDGGSLTSYLETLCKENRFAPESV